MLSPGRQLLSPASWGSTRSELADHKLDRNAPRHCRLHSMEWSRPHRCWECDGGTSLPGGIPESRIDDLKIDDLKTADDRGRSFDNPELIIADAMASCCRLDCVALMAMQRGIVEVGPTPGAGVLPASHSQPGMTQVPDQLARVGQLCAGIDSQIKHGVGNVVVVDPKRQIAEMNAPGEPMQLIDRCVADQVAPQPPAPLPRRPVNVEGHLTARRLRPVVSHLQRW